MLSALRVPGEPGSAETIGRPAQNSGEANGGFWELAGASGVMDKIEHWESNSFWRRDFDAPVKVQSLFNLLLFKAYLSLTSVIWSCAGCG